MKPFAHGALVGLALSGTLACGGDAKPEPAVATPAATPAPEPTVAAAPAPPPSSAPPALPPAAPEPAPAPATEPHGATPSIRLATIQAASGISADAVQNAALGSLTKLRGCYAEALKKTPGLEGRVVTKLTIDASGKVKSASDDGSDITDKKMLTCVQDTLKKVSFPGAKGTSPASTVVPALFFLDN